ncbi:MAG: hypothetical protein M0P61_03745 [Ignavibacteriaceae bacterium]|jgi:hypothetical protein|nr:hypothetical protein [Ignavibacteriaceae bacterium]
MKLISLQILVLLAFAGCSSERSIKQNANGNITAEQLYKDKCGGCHALYQREKFAKGDWESVLVRMEKKAHLDMDQSNLIRQYLIAQTDSVKN